LAEVELSFQPSSRHNTELPRRGNPRHRISRRSCPTNAYRQLSLTDTAPFDTPIVNDNNGLATASGQPAGQSAHDTAKPNPLRDQPPVSQDPEGRPAHGIVHAFFHIRRRAGRGRPQDHEDAWPGPHRVQGHPDSHASHAVARWLRVPRPPTGASPSFSPKLSQ
jgi:hypothetical protein